MSEQTNNKVDGIIFNQSTQNTSHSSSNSSSGSSCWGCLSEIVGAIIILSVIFNWLGSCSPDSSKPTNSPAVSSMSASADEPESTTPEDYSATAEDSASEKEYTLSDRATVVSNLYFHTLYTDLGTVTIHSFDERAQILDYMATLTADKELTSSGTMVAYSEKLFGQDYYYATAGETPYYYIGDLKDNRPHGFGAIVGLAEGNGTYAFSGELLFYYVGNFKNGMKHGFGVEFNTDECDITQAVSRIISEDYISETYGEHLCHYLFNHVSYEGFWKENQYHGDGNLFRFPTYDGIYYFHPDINHKIEGYVYGNAYPNVTQGQWKNGALNGDVAIYKFNHNDYIGQVKDGKADGRGTLYYSENKPQYTGEFRNDKFHGEGTYYNLDGTISYSGKWEHGDYAH